MQANIEDHVDPLTGEVNATSLAEDCYTHYHPEDQSENEIPDVYFDTAQKIATAYEIKTGVREGRIGSAVGGYINTIPGGSL